MTQSKNPFKKMFAALAFRTVFVHAILLLFAQKADIIEKILIIFSGKAWELKKAILNILN
jgi:2-C-methyl-D-erythritol 4-phosphate cytidylyltransferase